MGWFRRPPRQELDVIVRLEWPTHSVRRPVERRSIGATRVVIPTDLLVAAWRQLFPAERMVMFGGRRTAGGVRVTSVFDVTEARPSAGHVRSCPAKLSTGLVDLDRTGTHLCVWMHSHPGTGRGATFPSATDLNQDRDLRRDYSTRLVGIIAARDGCLRLFGQAVEHRRAEVVWRGKGIEEVFGDEWAYRIRLT